MERFQVHSLPDGRVKGQPPQLPLVVPDTPAELRDPHAPWGGFHEVITSLPSGRRARQPLRVQDNAYVGDVGVRDALDEFTSGACATEGNHVTRPYSVANIGIVRPVPRHSSSPFLKTFTGTLDRND